VLLLRKPSPAHGRTAPSISAAITARASSGQVTQKACPFSGGEIKADKTVEFKGAKVAFCCDNCKGKAEKMSDDDKVANLFGEDAFAKAKFAKATK
jgi:hypothetical protein